MLGIRRPDRHLLPRITPTKHADPDSCDLPRERVRSSAHRRHPTSSRAWCYRQRSAYRHALPQPRGTIAKTVRLLELP
jgi:hypothetical protein